MAKLIKGGLVNFPAVIAGFLLWVNSYACSSGDYFQSLFAIVIVIAVPLLALLFVKLYKKYEMRTTEKSFKILFIIFFVLLFLSSWWGDFGDWLQHRVFPSYWYPAEVGAYAFGLISILTIIAVPLLAKLFVRLYKKRTGNIDEDVLFIICIIPFLWGFIDWITNWGSYTLFKYYEHDPYTYGISPIGMSVVGNFNLARGMVITYMAVIVVAALKKDNIKCCRFLPKLFVLAGIYNVTYNLEHVIQNISFMDFDEFNFVMGTLGSLVPLLLALGCVMISLLVSFLHGFFSKDSRTDGL